MSAPSRFRGHRTASVFLLSAGLASVLACGNGDDHGGADGGSGGGGGTGSAESGTSSGGGGSGGSCTVPASAPPALDTEAGTPPEGGGCFTEPAVIEECVINGGDRKCTGQCATGQYEVACGSSSSGSLGTPAASLHCTSISDPGTDDVHYYCCTCGS